MCVWPADLQAPLYLDLRKLVTHITLEKKHLLLPSPSFAACDNATSSAWGISRAELGSHVWPFPSTVGLMFCMVLMTG